MKRHTDNVATLAAFVLAALATAPAAHSADAEAAGDAASVERGRYLVSIAGCHDCHTPFKAVANGFEPDMSRALSGHPQDLVIATPAQVPQDPWLMVAANTNTAYSGPWGVSFTANLTPDMETGLGRWTVRNFVDTIRSGRHMGRGRQILPPMPYPVYRNMTDEDLAAVFRYLQTLPAISNKVPEPLPPAMAP